MIQESVTLNIKCSSYTILFIHTNVIVLYVNQALNKTENWYNNLYILSLPRI